MPRLNPTRHAAPSRASHGAPRASVRPFLFQLSVLAANLAAVTLITTAPELAVGAWLALNALALTVWKTLDAPSQRAGLVLQLSLALFALVTGHAVRTQWILQNPVSFALTLLATFGLALIARRAFVPNQTTATVLACANGYAVLDTQPSLASDLPAGTHAARLAPGIKHNINAGQTVHVHVHKPLTGAAELTIIG